MSDPNTPQPQPVAGQPMAGHPDMPANAVIPTELRLHSHSTILYWWPVWAFGFLFSLLTLMDNHRMVIVPSGAVLTKVNEGTDAKPKNEVVLTAPADSTDRILRDSVEKDGKTYPKIRMSSKGWMGPTFVIILLLVIFITNVPLRGTLSIIVILAVVVMSLMFALFGWWDDIFGKFADLHVYINLAGYAFISTVLFVGWCVAIFFIDRRTFIVFTRGSIRVREEIGGREKTYDTTGMSVTKLRDDLFRHIFLGIGTGDLVVQTFGAEKHEIRMANIWMIDRYLPIIEQMMKK